MAAACQVIGQRLGFKSSNGSQMKFFHIYVVIRAFEVIQIQFKPQQTLGLK